MSIIDTLARIMEATGLGDLVRAHYAAEHGTCATCARPLSGPSPSQLCEPCHVAQVLAAGLVGDAGGDA